MVGFATVAAAGLIVFAPRVVRLLLGPDYQAVVPILCLASLALPMAAASSMLSIQWMLPLGRDKALVAVALASALVTITASRSSPASTALPSRCLLPRPLRSPGRSSPCE